MKETETVLRKRLVLYCKIICNWWIFFLKKLHDMRIRLMAKKLWGESKSSLESFLVWKAVSSIKATISLADGDYLGLSEEQDLKKLRKHQKLTRNNLIKYLTKANSKWNNVWILFFISRMSSWSKLDPVRIRTWPTTCWPGCSVGLFWMTLSGKSIFWMWHSTLKQVSLIYHL